MRLRIKQGKNWSLSVTMRNNIIMTYAFEMDAKKSLRWMQKSQIPFVTFDQSKESLITKCSFFFFLKQTF